MPTKVVRHDSRYTPRYVRTAWAQLILMLMAVSGAPASAELIVTFGDSNTAGGADAYPGLLMDRLDQQFGLGRFSVVNYGVSGLTTAGLLTSLDQEDWLDSNPDFAFIMIGGNDLWPLLSSPNVSALLAAVQQAVANVQTAVDRIRSHPYPMGHSPKVIVSAYVPNRLPNAVVGGLSINPNLAVETLNANLAQQLTGADRFFTENFSDLIDPASQKARATLMRDNVHLNQAGRQIVAENFAELVVANVPEPSSGRELAVGMALVGVAILAQRRPFRRATSAELHTSAAGPADRL